MYYFLLTKLKHYSVTCGRVSREKGVQGDGFCRITIHVLHNENMKSEISL